jgi:signal transduction histidine kinase
MLGNLKLVLRQHKKFLAIFFFIVFLPSLILAALGIRAIQNERYKLRHQNQQLQMEFVETFQDEVLFLIERNSSSLMEISTSRAFVTSDYPAVRDLLAQRSQERSLLGHTVIWNQGGPPWLPGFQEVPAAAGSWTIPPEWKRLQLELAKAEEAEFRRKNYSDAVDLYNQILRRAQDSHVKAWIQSRVARCQDKQEKFKQALSTYRSILADFPDLHTESGRPLAPITCLQILEALRSDNDFGDFFQESLEFYQQLEQNVWSLDGAQLELYSNMLQSKIDGVAPEGTPPSAPQDYASSVENIRKNLKLKLDIWHATMAVKNDILPGLKESQETTTSSGPQIHQESFERDGQEFLVLILPVDRSNTGQYVDFIGSLIPSNAIVNALDPRVTENRLPGAAIHLRSMISGKIIYSSGASETLTEAQTASDTAAYAEAGGEPQSANPVHADIFPENSPPWRVEVFETENALRGFYLYKNIFFWTILALLVILFLGSGLIIRTIVQEVNLLNLKSDFIASVSHEFKTPLTAMGAILERLLDDEVQDPQKAREYYRILSHDSERLKRLVKNVLDFTKIEEGKRKYRMFSLDIVELVRREVDSFEKENNLAGYTVSLDIHDDIPPVLADEEAMSQALHNILDNAAKFSALEKNIDLEVRRTKDMVEISVKDRGIGIPENEQKKIFEKFFRGKSASKVSPTGTGLGLALVKHIMAAHKGEVNIQSQPGKGSHVSLILPLGEGG